MKAGYARVSTKEQTVDLQVDALKKAGCTTVYTEIMSGTRAERPILGGGKDSGLCRIQHKPDHVGLWIM
jgi:predicted site-specific integrase-resolvase